MYHSLEREPVCTNPSCVLNGGYCKLDGMPGLYRSTEKTIGATLSQLHDLGWTNKNLVEHGLFVRIDEFDASKTVEGCARMLTATVGDMTIREFQTNLPWSIKYSADFRANPQPHKDFAHALTHIHKATGKLSAFVDDMDHRKETALDTKWNREEYTKYIADLVICALRMANTFPGGVIDLQNAVKDRLETKNGVKL
jgi:hypothetical protein